MTTHDSLHDLSACELATLIGQHEISSREVVEACLAQIEAREPEIGAFAYLDPEFVRAQAEAADEMRATGQTLGSLHGVPIGLKDIIETADMPTEHGSPIFKGFQPDSDATLVTGLKQAGAIMIGKTVTTELAVMHPGKTRNPNNIDHTPGGSSSGSAAGVAACMFPAAIGSQTGGSILRPSSFCGVYGFKPTHGRVPRPGVITQSTSLDTMGPIARSIDDLALITDAMSLYDPRDISMSPRSTGNLMAAANGDLPATPKLAFVKTANWELADPGTHSAFDELISVLGASVDEVDLDKLTAEASANHMTTQLAEIGRNYGPLHDKYPGKVSPNLVERIDKGRALSAPEYILARDRRATLNRSLSEVFQSYDAILTPASPGPAPVTLQNTGNPIFNGLWTYLGLPAITIPVFQDAAGMPFGAQLVGPLHDDGRLLRTAKWFTSTIGERTIKPN